MNYNLPTMHYHLLMRNHTVTKYDGVQIEIPELTVFKIKSIYFSSSVDDVENRHNGVTIRTLKKWNQHQRKKHPKIWKQYTKTTSKTGMTQWISSPFSMIHTFEMDEFSNLSEDLIAIPNEVVQRTTETRRFDAIQDYVESELFVDLEDLDWDKELKSLKRRRREEFELNV